LGLTPRTLGRPPQLHLRRRTLNDSEIADLQLVDSELRAFEFCDEGPAKERLRPYVWPRASAALEALGTGRVRYLQDGYA
jgi:8-oxo-dGTP diphosphatase